MWLFKLLVSLTLFINSEKNDALISTGSRLLKIGCIGNILYLDETCYAGILLPYKVFLQTEEWQSPKANVEESQ